MSTDRLLFRASPVAEGNISIYEWAGDWPPPPKLIRAEGQTGHSVFDPETVDQEALQAARDHGTITFQPFIQASASQMKEAAREDEHWFRGAVYLPEITE